MFNLIEKLCGCFSWVKTNYVSSRNRDREPDLRDCKYQDCKSSQERDMVVERDMIVEIQCCCFYKIQQELQFSLVWPWSTFWVFLGKGLPYWNLSISLELKFYRTYNHSFNFRKIFPHTKTVEAFHWKQSNTLCAFSWPIACLLYKTFSSKLIF